jgi:putative ABC transport system substrate-binding protein
MTRKPITVLPVTLTLASVHLAEAQQVANAYRIGYLLTASRKQAFHFMKAFEEGLRDLGYVGKNLIIEYRFANGKMEQLPQLGGDVVRHKVDVIVTGVNSNTVAAKEAASTIPIVMAGNDPVGTGLIRSLSPPGGNITGLSVDVGEGCCVNGSNC